MAGIMFSNVSFSYAQKSKPILENFNLEVHSNKITLFTGICGSGKSTLLYLAAGLYPKHAGVLHQGRITVEGQETTHLDAQEKAMLVGMVFQNPDLQFCMDTVENELIFCMENIDIQPSRMDEVMEEALSFCEIKHLKHRALHTLSGGEKQKAMLACAVVLAPKWLLLDEPFANIDEQSARSLAKKLQAMKTRYKTSILAVDHHLDVWEEVADEVIVMGRGGDILLRDIAPSKLGEKTLTQMGVGSSKKAYQIEKPQKVMQTNQTVLELRNLQLKRQDTCLMQGVDFEFKEGRIYAILGKSGSGKSTLFHTFCRMTEYSGSIALLGRELKKIPRMKMKHSMGFVFQNPQDQFVANTVQEEIAASLAGSGSQKNESSVVEHILKEIGLWRYRQVSPFMLSQGQQRKLAVAALLAYDCRILICDEPTYAQDRNSTSSIMDALQNYVVSKGATLIFSTHDRLLAKNYADTVLEIHGGKLKWISNESIHL